MFGHGARRVRTAATTRFWFANRILGMEMLIAATACPFLPNTGALKQQPPRVLSSMSFA